MSIIKSDDFAGLGAGSALASRSLNHALGGSGSETWASTGATGATGGGAVTSGSLYSAITLSANGKARIKFQFSSSTNHAVWLRGTGAEYWRSTFMALFVGTTSLRIREHNSSGASLGDVTTVTVSALSTGTNYYLECEFDGTSVHARVFQSDGTTQIGSTASYTPGTYPTGDKIGFGNYSGTGGTYDDFTLDDSTGGGGGGPFPFKKKSVDGGGMQNLGGMSIR